MSEKQALATSIHPTRFGNVIKVRVRSKKRFFLAVRDVFSTFSPTKIVAPIYYYYYYYYSTRENLFFRNNFFSGFRKYINSRVIGTSICSIASIVGTTVMILKERNFGIETKGSFLFPASNVQGLF